MQSPILYLLGAYPCWSETFIRQDLRLLLEAGVPLLPVSLLQGDCEMQDDWPAVVCLAPPGRPRKRTCARCDLGRRLIPRRWRHIASLCRHRPNSRALTSFAQKHAVRHIHAEFADLPGLLAADLSRRLGITYSIGVHARDVHRLKYDSSFLFRRAAFVTACNRSARDRLATLCPDIEPRLKLIHHGLVLDEWPFADTDLQERSETHMRLLYVGRFTEKKGIPILLKAAAMTAGHGTPVQLTLVGGGPEEPSLRQLAAELALTPPITWAGVVPRTAVRDYLLQADGLVVPSVVAKDGDQDGIPNVVLEAMASGTPVIGTDAGGLGEVLSDQTGFLCAPGDPAELAEKIRETWRNPRVAREKCRNARTLLESEFDARALTRERARLLETVLLKDTPPV